MGKRNTTDWRAVFRREAAHTENAAFRELLLGAVADAPWAPAPQMGGRPSFGELREAMMSPGTPNWARSVNRTGRARSRPLESLLLDLHGRSWRSALRAGIDLRRKGAEVLPALLEDARKRPGPDAWALRIAEQIAADTLETYGRDPDSYVCPVCLVRYAVQREGARGGPRFCGCRACGRSRQPMAQGGEIVAVLDAHGSPKPEHFGDTLRVNWLARARGEGFEGAHLFDFDRVEIVRADDAEVRHFLVDVANDTDPVRKKRYPKAQCAVAAACDLSEATMRQLRGVFGEVVVRN